MNQGVRVWRRCIVFSVTEGRDLAEMRVPRIIMAFMLAFPLAFAASGCAKTSYDVIRDAVVAEFDPYKNLEPEALERIAYIAEDEGLSELGISGAEFASSVLEGFDYTVDDIRINGEKAVAYVTITSKSASDFDEGISRDVQAFVESARSQSLDSEQRAYEIGNIALDSIRNADMVSERIEIIFSLKDKTWVSENISDTLSKLDILAYRG